jgi:hypothetical protein
MLEAKSLVRKFLGIADPWKAFRDYERRIHPDTWAAQPAILDWLKFVAPHPGPSDRPTLEPTASDHLVRLFAVRWADLERQYAGKHARRADELRVLIHLPPFDVASATYSLLQNLGDGLTFLGVSVGYWEHWDGGTPLGQRLHEFRPTVLMSVDHRWYGPVPAVSCEALEAVWKYRRRRPLILGLSCNQFPSDQAILRRNMAYARELGADFFYSYQTASFVRDRYRPFTDAGFPVLSLEFGANPLRFHPVPGVERDLNFVYLASCNFEKWEREAVFLARVFHHYPGLILGPGWPRTTAPILPTHQLRFLYARALVGINLHVPFQIADPTELNERAYNLAVSGTPQLMDNPALLPARFGPESVYSARTPEEYYRLFLHILGHPDEARARAANALEDVFRGHTVMHRADHLVAFLDSLVQ